MRHWSAGHFSAFGYPCECTCSCVILAICSKCHRRMMSCGLHGQTGIAENGFLKHNKSIIKSLISSLHNPNISYLDGSKILIFDWIIWCRLLLAFFHPIKHQYPHHSSLVYCTYFASNSRTSLERLLLSSLVDRCSSSLSYSSSRNSSSSSASCPFFCVEEDFLHHHQKAVE